MDWGIPDIHPVGIGSRYTLIHAESRLVNKVASGLRTAANGSKPCIHLNKERTTTLYFSKLYFSIRTLSVQNFISLLHFGCMKYHSKTRWIQFL
jgi:hypothetical protein